MKLVCTKCGRVFGKIIHPKIGKWYCPHCQGVLEMRNVDEAEEIGPEDLEAAADMFDGLIKGTKDVYKSCEWKGGENQ